jgi:hypothetical protein
MIKPGSPNRSASGIRQVSERNRIQVLAVGQLTLQQISTGLLLQSIIGFIEQSARAQKSGSPIGQGHVQGWHQMVPHRVAGHGLVGVTRILNKP